MPQLVDIGNIAREHFRRRVFIRAVAPGVRKACERRCLLRFNQRRAAEIDQADVKPVRGYLLCYGLRTRANHDVVGRKIAVHQASVELFHLAEHLQDRNPYGCNGGCGNPRSCGPRFGGEHRARMAQRFALDPFHQNGGKPIDGSIAVQRGETLEVGQDELRAVLLVKGIDESLLKRFVVAGALQRIGAQAL